MSAGSRYELSLFIGPCSEAESEALAEAILELDEARAVAAGGVGIRHVPDDDPFFAEVSP